MSIFKNFRYIIVFSILSLLALVPLLAFKDGYLIGASEHQTWLKSEYVLDDFFSLWSNRFNSLSLDSTQFFRYFSLKISNFFFPDNPYNNQKLILLSFSFLQPFAIYFLFTHFFEKIEYKVIGGLSASLFYAFNLFYLIHINLMLHHVNLILSFAPLILVLLIKLLNSKLNWKDYKSLLISISIAICFLPLASSANNPPNLFSVLILGLIFLIFYFKKNKNCIYKIINLCIIIILINAFWIFNAFVYWTSIFDFYITEYVDVKVSNLNQWNLVDKYYLNEFFRLSGLPAFESYWFYNYFENVHIISFLSHISTFICFLGIFISDEENKSKKKFLYITLLIFLFLIKGINPPLGIFFRQLFENIDYMYMFRNPAAKFGNAYIILLSLAYGYSIVKIYEILKIRNLLKKISIIILVFTTTVVVGFPRLMDDKTILLDKTDHHIKIPTYWYDLDNWLIENDFTQSKMMLLPESDRSTMYNLDDDLSVMSQPIAYQLLPNKMLWKKDFDYNYDQTEVNNVIKKIDNHDNLREFLDNRNIQFILLQGDIVTDHFRYQGHFIRSESWHEDNLDSSGLFFKRKFGKLTLYIYKNYVRKNEFNFFNATFHPGAEIITDDEILTNSTINKLKDDISIDIFNMITGKTWTIIENDSHYSSKYLGRNTYKIISSKNLANQMIIFDGNYNKNWIIYLTERKNLKIVDRIKILFGLDIVEPFLFKDKATWYFENVGDKKNYFVIFKFQYIFELLISLSKYISSLLILFTIFLFLREKLVIK